MVGWPPYFTIMESPTIKQGRKDQMPTLAEAILNYGEVMRELGQRESARNLEEEAGHRDLMGEDIDRLAVRVAKTKFELLQAKTKTGGMLIEWSKEWADKFFEPVSLPIPETPAGGRQEEEAEVPQGDTPDD